MTLFGCLMILGLDRRSQPRDDAKMADIYDPAEPTEEEEMSEKVIPNSWHDKISCWSNY